MNCISCIVSFSCAFILQIVLGPDHNHILWWIRQNNKMMSLQKSAVKTKTLRGFELSTVIGKGSYGEVWLARHIKDRKQVSNINTFNSKQCYMLYVLTLSRVNFYMQVLVMIIYNCFLIYLKYILCSTQSSYFFIILCFLYCIILWFCSFFFTFSKIITFQVYP